MLLVVDNIALVVLGKCACDDGDRCGLSIFNDKIKKHSTVAVHLLALEEPVMKAHVLAFQNSLGKKRSSRS